MQVSSRAHDPDPRVGSGSFQNITGRVGPGRVGSGRVWSDRVRRVSKSHGWRRVTLTLARPDPNRPASFAPTHE